MIGPVAITVMAICMLDNGMESIAIPVFFCNDPHCFRTSQHSLEVILKRKHMLVCDKQHTVIPVVPIGQRGKKRKRRNQGFAERKDQPDINLHIVGPRQALTLR